MPPLDDNLDVEYEVDTPPGEINDFGGNVVDEDVEDLSAADRGDVPEDDADEPEAPAEPAAEEAPREKEPDEEEQDTAAEAEKTDDGADPEEAPDQDDTDDAEKQSEKPVGVPKARLNKEAEKRREAERQAEQYRQELEKLRAVQEAAAAPQAETAEEMETRLAKALELTIEAEPEKAAQEFAKILRDEVQKARDEVLSSVGAKQDAAPPPPEPQLPESVTQAVEQIVSDYPELDPKHPEHDVQFFDEVMVSRDYWLNRGYPVEEALRRAATNVASELGISPVQRQREIDQERKQVEVEKQRINRTRENIDKKLKQAEAQPDRIPGTNRAVEKELNIMELPEAEFEKLSEEELRRARGDFG